MDLLTGFCKVSFSLLCACKVSRLGQIHLSSIYIYMYALPFFVFLQHETGTNPSLSEVQYTPRIGTVTTATGSTGNRITLG